MKILFIANSFGEDTTRYLHGIARADGKNWKVVNLYIGGCSLYRHYRNMLSADKAYSLELNGVSSGFYVSLSEALLSDEWDVVTLQQCSHESTLADSYEPYLSRLAAFVREYAPKAKLWKNSLRTGLSRQGWQAAHTFFGRINAPAPRFSFFG